MAKKTTATPEADPKLAKLRAAFHAWPLEQVPLSNLAGKEKNSRIDTPQRRAEIVRMAANMALVGQLQPACGYHGSDGRVHLVWGFGRAEACALAEIPHLVVKVCPAIMSPDEVEFLRGAENIFRQQFSGAELALQVKAAFDASTTAGNVAGGADAVYRHVAERFALRGGAKEAERLVIMVGRLTPSSQRRLAEGKLTLEQAKALVEIGGPDQDALAEELAESMERGVERDAGYIRGVIANKRCSLKIVSWPLEVHHDTKVYGGAGRVFGTGEKVGCDRCQHNSGSDASLFGAPLDKKNAAVGFCQMPTCYEKKREMAEAAKQAAVAKMVAEVKAGKITDVAARADQMLEKQKGVGQLVKTSTVQRAVARQLEVAGLDTFVKRPQSAAKVAEKKAETDTQKRQAAMLAWGKAYEAWGEKLGKAFDAHIAGDPLCKLAVVALAACLPAWPQWEMPDVMMGSTTMTKPAPEPAIKPAGARLVHLAGELAVGKISPEDLRELAGEIEYPFDGYKVEEAWEMFNFGPVLIERIVTAFGMPFPGKAGLPPVFEDFLPKELQAAKVDPAPALKDNRKPGRCFKCGGDKGPWVTKEKMLCMACVNDRVGIGATANPADFKMTLEQIAELNSAESLMKDRLRGVVLLYSEIPFACIGSTHQHSRVLSCSLVRVVRLESWNKKTHGYADSGGYTGQKVTDPLRNTWVMSSERLELQGSGGTEKPAVAPEKAAKQLPAPTAAMFEPEQLVWFKPAKCCGRVVEMASSLNVRVKLAGGTIQEWRCTDCRKPKDAEVETFVLAESDAAMAMRTVGAPGDFVDDAQDREDAEA